MIFKLVKEERTITNKIIIATNFLSYFKLIFTIQPLGFIKDFYIRILFKSKAF